MQNNKDRELFMSFEFPRSTPEKQGIDSKLLTRIIEQLYQLDYIKGFIFLRHGSIIAEGYQKPYSGETAHALWSLSKSFTSCAIGFAREEKLLDLNGKLISFFPEYRSCVTDEKMLDVTLQDLLTMRSGHANCAYPYAKADSANDWVRGFLSSPLEHVPGTFFAYNSLATYMLSAVIRRVTGLNVREYLIPRLFDPLEITPGLWECCPAGTNLGGFGFHLKTMDIAKFAQLLLNKGKWNGVQILPEAYLEEAVYPHADNSMNQHPDWKCGYGYQFWRSRFGFRGDGACGQYAIVLPEEDIAIAINGSLPEMGRILDLLWEKFLPGVHSAALPEDPAAVVALEKLCRSGEIQPPAVENKKDLPGYSFRFFPNSVGIQSGTIQFFPEKCILSLETARGTETINAGFGTFENSRIRLQDSREHEVTGYAFWKTEDLLEINIFHLDSTFRDTWSITFQNDTLEFSWETKCSLFRPLLPPLKVIESGKL